MASESQVGGYIKSVVPTFLMRARRRPLTDGMRCALRTVADNGGAFTMAEMPPSWPYYDALLRRGYLEIYGLDTPREVYGDAWIHHAGYRVTPRGDAALKEDG